MAKKISEQTIKELKEYFATFLKDAKARIKWATDDKIRDIQNTIRVENNKGTFWGHPEILARYERQEDEVYEWVDKSLARLEEKKAEFNFMIDLMRSSKFTEQNHGTVTVFNFHKATVETLPAENKNLLFVRIVGYNITYGRYPAYFYAEKAKIVFEIA